MKVICTFEMTVDGEMPSDSTIVDAFFKQLDFGVITSEDFDGSEDWALIVKTCTAEVQHSELLHPIVGMVESALENDPANVREEDR